VPEIFILQNLILRTRSCVTGRITQCSWVFHFRQTTLVSSKCFVTIFFLFPPDHGQIFFYFHLTTIFFYFHLTTLVWSKCFVPQLHQFRRGISGGPALKYFYMIHGGGRLYGHRQVIQRQSSSRLFKCTQVVYMGWLQLVGSIK